MQADERLCLENARACSRGALKVLTPAFPRPRPRTQDLPADYYCPICGAPKDRFKSKLKVVAGFAENQKYGLGTNSMTSNQKLLLIYGALALFFLLFLGGYALE